MYVCMYVYMNTCIYIYICVYMYLLCLNLVNNHSNVSTEASPMSMRFISYKNTFYNQS